MRFKTWLHNEMISGPGGGPESQPTDQAALAQNIAQHGAGAFLMTGDEPVPNKTATAGYVKGAKKAANRRARSTRGI